MIGWFQNRHNQKHQKSKGNAATYKNASILHLQYCAEKRAFVGMIKGGNESKPKNKLWEFHFRLYH